MGRSTLGHGPRVLSLPAADGQLAGPQGHTCGKVAGSQVMTPREGTAPGLGISLPRLPLSPHANDSSARGKREGAGHTAQGQADIPGRSVLRPVTTSIHPWHCANRRRSL